MTNNMEIVGFEHLHLHTDYSALDGYSCVEEYSTRAKKINQKFLCISDHGVMGSVPRQLRACEKAKISPIHACELYVNPFQMELKEGESSGDYAKHMSPEEKLKFKKSYHLLAIAYNTQGYTNLVKLSSWGWTKGFYYKPRVNHEMIMKHKEGIIFTSCCYNGEIGQAFDKGGEGPAMEMVEKYMAMFGENFYLELMLLDFTKQKPYDAFIIKAHEKYGIPLIITNDVHYCEADDSKMQRLMLMIQTKRTVQDIQKMQAADETADLFELQDPNLWQKSEEELNQKWISDYSGIIDYDLFKQAKQNTVKICEKAKGGVILDRSIKFPQIPDDEEKLFEAIKEGFNRRNLPYNKEYCHRIKEEYELIKYKRFCSYFLIQKTIVDEARRASPGIYGFGDGSDAVGPGRGSVVGSLVAYCLGITDVDPIKHGLLFSRFLSPARGGRSLKVRFSSEPISKKSDQEVIELSDDLFVDEDV